MLTQRLSTSEAAREVFMLRALAILGSVVLAAVAAVLIFAVTKPDSFRVERTATIGAPPDRIYPYIDDLKRWTAWSPYEGRDPAMKRTYSGAARGKGAIYAWDGNNDVGQGRMEIVDATQPTRVVIKLDFIRPFEGHNTAEFLIQSRGDKTSVTWAMYGPSTFVSKLIGTFMDMDEMIGKDFAAGLAKLKTVVEKP